MLEHSGVFTTSKWVGGGASNMRQTQKWKKWKEKKYLSREGSVPYMEETDEDVKRFSADKSRYPCLCIVKKTMWYIQWNKYVNPCLCMQLHLSHD